MLLSPRQRTRRVVLGLIAGFSFCASFLTLIHCTNRKESTSQNTHSKNDSAEQNSTRPLVVSSPNPTPEPEYRLTLAAIGDLMMHVPVVRAGEVHEKGLAGLWQEITPWFKTADIVLANVETPLAPKTGKPRKPFMFNGPAILAKNLVDSGIHLGITANNHAYDQGPKGVVETLEHFSAAKLVPVGTGRNAVEAQQPWRTERHGITLAFFAASDVMNINLNKDPQKAWVNALNLEALGQAIAEERSKVDVVVVSLHWGVEYQAQPNERQTQIAQSLIDAGADVIIGHHPHVLQKIAPVQGATRKGLVAFSLGNFLSNQDRAYTATSKAQQGDSRDTAGLRIEFTKKGHGPVAITHTEYEPFWGLNEFQRTPKGYVRMIETVPIRPRLADPNTSASLRKILEIRKKRIRERLGAEYEASGVYAQQH